MCCVQGGTRRSASGADGKTIPSNTTQSVYTVTFLVCGRGRRREGQLPEIRGSQDSTAPLIQWVTHNSVVNTREEGTENAESLSSHQTAGWTTQIPCGILHPLAFVSQSPGSPAALRASELRISSRRNHMQPQSSYSMCFQMLSLLT